MKETATQQEIWQKIWPVLSKQYKRTATFLDYKNPWELLVAVILSAQTTDDMVNRVTPELFAKYPGPKELSKAPTADIARIIRRIGYYNSKSKYIQETAKILLRDFKGIVPDNDVDLQKLRGVGRKTAVAVLSNAFNKNIGIPVDTHVIRFVKRFHLSNATDPNEIEKELLEIIPKKDWRRAGYAIKEYGRKEGRARNWKPEEDPVWKIYTTVVK
jgi:endonuclease-3